MTNEIQQLQRLITGMRTAYAAGENVMAWAREIAGSKANSPLATLIAYDLQTGTYNALARRNPAVNAQWCAQLAAILAPLLAAAESVMEAGCGEATTLAGVLVHLPTTPTRALGFDLSWSRCAEGRAWLDEKSVDADLFVADLFHIPLADDSVDVVYTSHTLEPNASREEEALRELLRVTRRTLVLVEPAYELADEAARARMREHGYVRGLREILERLGAKVTRHELLAFSINLKNPSGLLVVEKNSAQPARPSAFQCPLTRTPLVDAGDAYVSDSTGLVYPVLRGIPLLRPEHAVVASKLESTVPVS